MKKSQNKKTSRYSNLKKNKLEIGGLTQPTPLPAQVSAPIQYNSAQQADPSAKGDLSSGVTKAAGSAGMWGGIYNATQSIGDAGRGDGLNKTDNTGANLLSPSGGFMRAVDDGEWGQAITGLLLPGLGGQNEAKRNAEKKATADLQQQVVTNKLLQQNAQAGMAFEHGGQLSSKLGVVKGGQLNKISKDAVEVKANNPGQTDSVELKDAFVDHNEVIDRKNRVFSDSLGFAKLAKKLEKQKNTGSRFKAANERIETKLDNLFQEQEESKAVKTAASYKRLALGGFIEEDPVTKVPSFKTEKEHINYYRPMAVGKFTPEDQIVYNDTLATKGQDFADAWIASRGGLPAFAPVQAQPKTIVYSGASLPSKFSNESNTGGYRYKAKGGKGLPAKKSINKPGRAIGGLLTDDFEVGPKPKGKAKLKEAGAVPFTLDDWRGMTSTQNAERDYTKYPLTVEEIKGWTQELKDKDLAWQNKMVLADQNKKPKKAAGGWMGTAGSLANIAAPTIASALARKKLKGPATPVMENRIGLKRVNADAQLADASNQFGQAEKVAQLNTAQSSDLISAIGNLRAKRVSANNQIQGQTQNINADIANNETQLNMGISARNAQRVTDFRQAGNDFSNMKQRLAVDNVANLSTKLQQFSAEKNREQLDQDNMLVNSWKFEDSGVIDRRMTDLETSSPDTYKRLRKQGYTKGGKMKGKKC